ncbi:phosphonate ABC transporter, periplasmic phosphonate-binding protein [Thermodesulfobium narugense DSM 14796]|uniref:Phosphonate ABC transporter, periplasmic phosphonate-binding protein n=1 Tax=Thermodesulfobium narugense DSM 14796 TaxID=747365 RepID=M1E7I1_9BACT|nr:phosphate/phosphite/phosphonate ABC transporter substrate-binding protein [Thermodesulfobium narugense]AEE15281.1 phosphonate ABC transporter, periplasmic phosphonate-binding protein [Thermodesulfobium narugense DSM 14796]
MKQKNPIREKFLSYKDIFFMLFFIVLLFVIGALLIINVNFFPTSSLNLDLTKKSLPVSTENEPNTIGIVVSSTLPIEEVTLIYKPLIIYLSKATNKHIVLFTRKTYSEALDSMLAGDAQIGIIGSGAFYVDKNKLDLLAVPMINNKTYYKSYIIAEKENIKNLSDLKGKTIAFTDPYSFAGYIVLENYLRKNGLNLNFFSKHFFTFSVNSSIDALKEGLADAATIDSNTYEQLKEKNPEISNSLHIIWESPIEIPNPPVIAIKDMDYKTKLQFQKLFMDMDKSTEGKKVLSILGYDKYVEVNSNFFEPISEWLGKNNENKF